MNKSEDVLLLFHDLARQQQRHRAAVPGGGAAVLSAQDVKASLDKEGIKNRVVIVSACFGGVFVLPLASEDSIVLTAADAAEHVVRHAPPGAELDLFRAMPCSSNRCSRERISGAPSITQDPDPQLGGDGPAAAVQPAGSFRGGADRKARSRVQAMAGPDRAARCGLCVVGRKPLLGNRPTSGLQARLRPHLPC